VVREPVPELEQTVVAELQHEHRGHRLGDRADPVLGGGGGWLRAGVVTVAAGPHERVVADHAGHQRRQARAALLVGHECTQTSRGGRGDRTHSA
jgi:hypothetical protein